MATKTIRLQAQPRTTKGRRAVGRLKKDGRVAGVVYGTGVEPSPLSVDLLEFQRVFSRAGESQVVTLTIEKEEHPVLIKDIAYDPREEEPHHIDFWKIDLKKEITAPVPILFEGSSLAVREEGGTLIRVIEELEVKALPLDLPESFMVDITSLKTFDDVIEVKDIEIPGNVEVLEDPTDVIATVEAPRSEEELEALDEAVEGDVTDVEGVTKETDDDGEEGEEGEEKAEGDEEKKEEEAPDAEDGGEEKKDE